MKIELPHLTNPSDDCSSECTAIRDHIGADISDQLLAQVNDAISVAERSRNDARVRHLKSAVPLLASTDD